MKIFRLFALLSAVLLAACTNTTKPSELPQFAISDVNVTVSEDVKSNSDIASSVRIAMHRIANAYSSELPESVPQKTLTVQVTNIHYKNPVLSILVGDGNRASAMAHLDGGLAKPIKHIDAGSYVINGVLGAAITIGGNKARVDSRLAVGLAEKAVASAYNQKGTPQFVRKKLSAR